MSAVKISNSSFLGQESLGINPQFTAFIGGRGTGKSTLMEYMRWALCDDPSAFGISSEYVHELPDFEKRRKNLINKTLKPLSGVVEVTYIKNGTPYVVTRDSEEATETVSVTSPDGIIREMSGKQVRSEFPLVSYAQKQLSCVGTLPEEIHRLIREPIEDKVSHLNDELKNIILSKLVERRQNEIKHTEYTEKHKDLSNRLALQEEQIASLQAQLLTSEVDRATLDAHAVIVREKQWLDGAKAHIAQLKDILLDARAGVDGLSDIEIPLDTPNQASTLSVAGNINRTRQAALSAIDEVISSLLTKTTTEEAATRELNKLETNHEQHEKDYQLALERHKAQSNVVSQIAKLNEQHDTTLSDLLPVSSELQRLAALSQQPGEDWWQLWLEKHTERSKLLKEQCDLTSLRADSAFRATIRPCGDKAKVLSAISTLFSTGRNIHGRDDKALSLAKIITVSNSPITRWSDFINEISVLVASLGGTVLPECLMLREAGLTDANIASLQSGLNKEIVEASRFPLFDDEIIFEFAFGKSDEGFDTFIPFEDASPGQQATALLKTLLAEAGPPLLIDQPEEDLDNEQMCDIADRIVQTKSNRQLLFVSHNANIVVNGDAELVVCFAYRSPNDRTKGRIEKTGSIDYEPIRKAVASVMEGGRDAFRLRHQKYDF